MKTLLFLLAVLSLAGEAVAQIAVQLPNYSSFSINTTVVVPDRGGMWIGGGGHCSFGGLRSAPPGQMLRTVRHGATGVGVSAWVHDHAELDRATLAKAGATSTAGLASPAPTPWRGDEGAPSIAALRRQRAAEQQQLAAQAATRRQAAEKLRAARVARAKATPAGPPKRASRPSEEGADGHR